MKDFPKSTHEQRHVVGVEFLTFVDQMHEGCFVWPKNKEFAEYCKLLFAKYQTGMDLVQMGEKK